MLLGEVTDEEIQQLEADTSYDSDSQDHTPKSGSLDDLMLEALEEYEHSAVTGGGATTTSLDLTPTVAAADGEVTESVVNLSVEEMDSFCEDFNHF